MSTRSLVSASTAASAVLALLTLLLPNQAFAERSLGTLYEHAKRIAAESGDDPFGHALSLHRDTLVVGAPFSTGLVHVLERSGGEWLETASFNASDTDYPDLFGYDVGLWKDTLVVGAPQGTMGGPGHLSAESDPGVAYIFERDAAGEWLEVVKLIPSDGFEGDDFGHQVEILGDRVAVGSPGAEAVYVFERDAGGSGSWGEVQKLSGAVDGFGAALAIDRRGLVVGAPAFSGEDDETVYVYEPSPTGSLELAAVLEPEGGYPGDGFGDSVAISGDTIAVGAQWKNGVNLWEGVAYIFARDASGVWSQTLELTGPEPSYLAKYGHSVGIEGDILLVGAHRKDNGSVDGAGAVYVHHRNEGGPDNWGPLGKLLASDAEANDYLGEAVVIDGTFIAVGATGDDDWCAHIPDRCNSGAVYIYEPQTGE